MSEITAADLDACAAEPIRIPGAIQPHGALLVVDPETLAPRHASANLATLTGLAPDAPLAGALAREVRRWLAGDDAVMLRVVEVAGARLQVQAHRTAQGAILEFEPPPASEADSLDGLYPRLRTFLDAIAAAPDVGAIAEAAVREIRALTGFNRVMLYSFDEKGDGTVLAEASDGVLPSYLGQRFPAFDIPAQARVLYTLNRIRIIPDADYVPSPVTPALSPVDGAPLDLSLASLRSVSPIHVEYMKNMGTGSSMSISIVVQGALWGLISAHNREAKRVNAQVRSACDMLGQILSLHVEARLQAAYTAERLALKQVETELLGRLAVASTFQGGLVENADGWMALVRAQGAGVVTEGGVRTVGMVPPTADIRALAAWLGEQGRDSFTTDSIGEVWPPGAAFAEAASGLVAISISRIRADFIFWFRPEFVRTIDWSGKPEKPEPRSERLHPRRSFELWRQQVRGRSRQWSPAEIESAEAFRSSIQSMVLKRAEERAELTDRLERSNRELEAFSYSISHDLRAPFRHIVGYAELLAEREKGLEGTSRHYLQTIKEAANAAGRLVDDLLQFSHLGRTQVRREPVDMRKLVGEVRRSLAPDVEGRVIDWRIGALPAAWGDTSMLRQVMQNLLQNAVKYTGPRERAEISVTGEDLGAMVAYTVADNGVGFEMQYVGKLFGVFQRLHRAEEFEGTGIGLALVKRIVERHGGTVTAEGTLGRGAVFRFTLPKRGEANGG